MSNYNILGKRIKEEREKLNLTQVDLANILNIANTTLSQYETGHRIPSDEIKIKLASLFGVSIDYLLGYGDNARNALTENLNQMDLCDFQREENSNIESGILLNKGSLGIIDIKGEKVERVWNYRVRGSLTIEIGKLL